MVRSFTIQQKISKSEFSLQRDKYLPDILRNLAIQRRIMIIYKVKESRNRTGVAQRVPGETSQAPRFSSHSAHEGGGVVTPHAPAVFTPRNCSWYSFSLVVESTPGPRNGWKEYVTEKSSGTNGNRSRDRRTSSAAP
jgi:hypothetical protein